MDNKIDYKELKESLLNDMVQEILAYADIDEMIEIIRSSEKQINEGKGIPADVAIAELEQIFIKKEAH